MKLFGRSGSERFGAASRSRTAGAVVVVVVLILVGFAQTSEGSSIARAIGLASPAERFTEMYFVRQARIAALTQGEVTVVRGQRVSFVIQNHESKQMTYIWRVRSGGTPRAAGTLTVDSGKAAVVRPARLIPTGCRFTRGPGKVLSHGRHTRVKSPALGPIRRIGPRRVQIVVSLLKPQESISYWVACVA